VAVVPGEQEKSLVVSSRAVQVQRETREAADERTEGNQESAKRGTEEIRKGVYRVHASPAQTTTLGEIEDVQSESSAETSV